MSVAPRLRVFQQQTTANRLWAYKQQALIGSCDVSRGSKKYTEFYPRKNSTGLFGFNCCQFVAGGDSKMMLWQNLGDMSAEEAQREYIRVVADVLPEWQSPPSSDAAMLRTWTPDDCSDRCSVCHEAFTFLNRRHHCRRCLNLVCAVCSPHAVPLRVFSEPTPKHQRVCVSCFNDVSSRSAASVDQVREASLPTPLQSDPPPYDDQEETDNGEASSESALSSSAAIHLGTLEFLQGTYGAKSKAFRKTWSSFFFVLLVRKGSLGMFASQAQHSAGNEPPTAVFKLSGYTLRIRSQPKRPHQFRLTHSNGNGNGGSPKKTLHFAASSLEEMNAWIAALIKAIAVAEELEKEATQERLQSSTKPKTDTLV
ncbi:E3 ubiquitin-protein ligase znrf1 [Phytophthora boehmeriae]|uniref:E3 ubiquitin-protein ligase znrf1 n=1 Tax=Phytophthora boehmeriae TaxID=109152 RepID=A0A8T1X017_9STRA|nr:E3 ubiquitin-protein ligase znrf1 [Phytophthora boehmeriae]